MMQDDLDGFELGGRNQRSIRGFREPINCPFQSFFITYSFSSKKCMCSLETLQLRAALALSCEHDRSWDCRCWILALQFVLCFVAMSSPSPEHEDEQLCSTECSEGASPSLLSLSLCRCLQHCHSSSLRRLGRGG